MPAIFNGNCLTLKKIGMYQVSALRIIWGASSFRGGKFFGTPCRYRGNSVNQAISTAILQYTRLTSSFQVEVVVLYYGGRTLVSCTPWCTINYVTLFSKLYLLQATTTKTLPPPYHKYHTTKRLTTTTDLKV